LVGGDSANGGDAMMRYDMKSKKNCESLFFYYFIIYFPISACGYVKSIFLLDVFQGTVFFSHKPILIFLRKSRISPKQPFFTVISLLLKERKNECVPECQSVFPFGCVFICHVFAIHSFQRAFFM